MLIRKSKKIRKRVFAGRILRVVVKNGRELQFHATKGWRSYRKGE